MTKQLPGELAMKSLTDMPYALFLAGMAAIIGCAVAIPRVFIAHNTWWVMLGPVVFSGAAFVFGLWSLRARGLSYRSTVGEESIARKGNLKTTRGNVKPAPVSLAWILFVGVIPAVSVLLGFTWMAISSYQHGQPIPAQIWIGFAMSLAIIPLAYLAFRRSRRSG
jgi:hypothetical protein